MGLHESECGHQAGTGVCVCVCVRACVWCTYVGVFVRVYCACVVCMCLCVLCVCIVFVCDVVCARVCIILCLFFNQLCLSIRMFSFV